MKKLLTCLLIVIAGSSLSFAEYIIYHKAEGRIIGISEVVTNLTMASTVWQIPVSKIWIGESTNTVVGSQVVTNPCIFDPTNLCVYTNNVYATNISELTDFHLTERCAHLLSWETNILAIADGYSVTNRPLNWFDLSTAIEAALADTNTMAAAQLHAIKLNSLRAFYQANGGDDFNIGDE